MAHAAEWGHWYDRKGNPVYEMPYADAKRPGTRPVTLRDARKLGLVPGVSGISRCAAAPALERWKQEQVLLSAVTLPRVEGEPMDALMERIRDDAQQQAEKARAKGTAIHAAIQGWYESFGQRCEKDFAPYVNSATDEIVRWMDVRPWNAEESFASPFGYGGKVDLSCSYGIVDFKTKEFDVDSDLKIWDEHAMQLAAYRAGIGHQPDARCAIVYVSVNNPGLSRLIEIPEEELQKGWRMFLALLQYWQAKNKYNSAWMPERVAA